MPREWLNRGVRASAVMLVAAALVSLEVSVAAATAPGRDGRIAFTRWTNPEAEYDPTLYTIRPDGTGIRRLMGLASAPAWSPRGGWLAFERYPRRCPLPGCETSVWVMRADGSGLRQVMPAWSSDPTWSADGRSLAVLVWHEDEEGIRSSNLWVVGTDGSGARQMTSFTDEYVYSPDWSPDGSRIIFAVSSGSWSLWVIRADGTGLHRVTAPKGAVDLHPSWSPSGRWIAFERYGSVSHVLVVRPNGRGLRRVTRGSSPDWSPDGRRLVYAKWIATEHVKLFTVAIDGSNLHQITWRVGFVDGAPDWRSIPR